jgi:GMP synthase-like glutamine amidotransferase
VVTNLPDTAEVLAASELYPIQAFRVGQVAWGLQFHLEATADMVRTWAIDEGLDLSVADAVALAADRLAVAGEQIAQRFAAIITG